MSINDRSALNFAFSGCDALKLLDIINRGLLCASENDFTGLFPSIQDLCPFDFAIALLGCIENNHFVACGGVDISLPDDFSRAYVSNDYMRTDAIVIESAMTQRLQYWPDDWARLCQLPEIVSLCMDTEMKTGFLRISRPTSLSNKASLFCFSAPSMPNEKRTEAIINLLVPHLHLSLSQTLNKRPPADNDVVLSPREKEVLRWLKVGKSSWEISIILSISERTVNFHVYKIMQKLDAVNRPQAVAAAIHLGLIDVD
jgi:DNA-binding CsgD family transcriptional regulator